MTQIICPVCNFAGDHFEPVGVNKLRQNAKCPRCGSYERHRLIWWYLRQCGLMKNGISLLDIAPMPALASAIRSGFDLNYVSIDRGGRRADVRMDMEKLAFDSGSFDGVLCMHVLEHVNNDHQALSELARVLRPGAWAVLMVPINEKMPQTDEDPNVTDPKERERRFGQSDHVRMYGADYEQRCERAGFRMQIVNMAEETDILARHALLPCEKIYLGWRA